MYAMVQKTIEGQVISQLNKQQIDDQNAIAAILDAAIQSATKIPSHDFDIHPNIFTVSRVLDPNFLREKHGIFPTIFLINAQFGALKQLSEYLDSFNLALSKSILYGEWDMVIVYWGGEAGAAELLRKLEIQSKYIVSMFGISKCLFCCKNRVPSIYDLEIASVIANTPDGHTGVRSDDDENAPSIGVYWDVAQNEKPDIRAFIGISFSGTSEEISGSMILERLNKLPVFRNSVVDFYEVRSGRPYHFFLKVCVKHLKELDAITDQIGFLKIGRAKFDGATFVIASEQVTTPSIQADQGIDASELPNIELIGDTAATLLSRVGVTATADFNARPADRQITILKSLHDISGELHRDPLWDEERAGQIERVFTLFSQAILKPDDELSLVGPSLEMGKCVEAYAKNIFRRGVEVVFGSDYSRAQAELKLPVRDYRKLTLGKTQTAFETIRGQANFRFLHDDLAESNLQRLSEFTDLRNRWAHPGATDGLPISEQIDEARRLVLSGITICRWLGQMGKSIISSANASEVRVHDKRTRGIENGSIRRSKFGPSIFLSHSSQDAEIAEKIARGIQAMGMNVWYSQWAIQPGESIVEGSRRRWLKMTFSWSYSAPTQSNLDGFSLKSIIRL